MEKWIQTNDFKVKRGELVLNIGDYIIYHDCAGENGEDLYKGRWQVLGVSDEGNILIVSKNCVTTHCFNKEHTVEGAMNAYSTGVETLDKICETYGKGAVAVGARSICIEDVDKLTGFNKIKNSKCGRIYTLKTKKEKLSYWHDGTCWHKTKYMKSTNLTNTYYMYYISYSDLPSNVYDMLFSRCYWLASPFVYATPYSACFGLRSVAYDIVGGVDFIGLNGHICKIEQGVRAVVTLKSDSKIIVTE